MEKKPRPFYRSQTKSWYVQLGKKQIRLGKNRSEAFAKYYELIAQSPPVDVQSCAELAYRYLEWLKDHRAPRTRDWYAYLLDKAMPVLVQTSVQTFKPYHVLEIEKLCPRFGQNSRHSLSRALHALFNWSCSQGFIESSPLKLHNKPRQICRDDCVTETGYKQICAVTKNLMFLRVVQFAWETGARPQEIFAMEVRHFQPELKRIVFSPEEAKMHRFRIIYLNDAAVSVVKDAVGGRKAGRVFLNSRGVPWNKDSINCQFARIKRITGQKYHLGAFRKGYITSALKNGVDTVTLSHLVGHADLGMISKVYAKLQHDPAHMLAMAQKARS